VCVCVLGTDLCGYIRVPGAVAAHPDPNVVVGPPIVAHSGLRE